MAMLTYSELKLSQGGYQDNTVTFLYQTASISTPH